MPTKGTGRGKKKTEQAEPALPVEQVEPPVMIQAPAEDTSPAGAVAAAPAGAVAAAPAGAKKRTSSSKKPVKVIAVVTPDGIEGSFTPEPRRPLIAHLQIRTNDILFPSSDTNHTTQGDPTGYDPSELNPFKGGQERLQHSERGDHVQVFGSSPSEKEEKQMTELVVPVAPGAAPAPAAAPVQKSMPCFTRSDLMVQFKESSEHKQLPASTDIACFWCAHPFEGMPCIIPEREVNAVYTVYGNFCCPECAVSYLLHEGLDPHVRWERMSLLQRIYDRNGTGRILPAPCRESLKMFGGPMSIEVYRATMREKKVRVDLHMPPMVSILGSIDTKPIDFFDTNLKQGGPVTAPAAAAQRAAEEGLRLKRTKPLKDKESTLDTVMNIKIGNGSGSGGLFGRVRG